MNKLHDYKFEAWEMTIAT